MPKTSFIDISGYCLLLIAHCSPLIAQTGSWQTHADYSNAKGLEIVKNKVYCHTQNGFFYFDKSDNQLVTLSKIDGLTESTIAQIRYNEKLQTLLIAYQSGNLDVLKISDEGLIENIKNINFILKTVAIQGSKNINQIEIKDNLAYLAADFGLLVFDVSRNEIKETYLNLGENGKELIINRIAFARDSIFLKTSAGIIGTKFASTINLQYFGNWKKINDKQLFDNQVFPKNDLITSPYELEVDKEGKIWIADGQNGLVSNLTGNFKKYNPNGVEGDIYQVFYESQKIYAVGTNTQFLEGNEWKNLQNTKNFSKKLIDKNGNIWESTGFGISIKNPTNTISKYLSTGKGTGNLPSPNINSIVEDRDGLVWVGTNNGIAVIANSKDIFSKSVDAYQPFYQGRRLFLQENVLAIAVDGGNRKWFGTPRGVSLFNASADELIESFTTENSPLPSDYVNDIVIHQQTGEVFFATKNGLISYKSDASEPSENYQQVKIFPNPIRPEFVGVLTISGLTENSSIKIVNISGKLIYETKSNGGIATWNQHDSQADAGVYSVFMISENGIESLVGKFLIIR